MSLVIKAPKIASAEARTNILGIICDCIFDISLREGNIKPMIPPATVPTVNPVMNPAKPPSSLQMITTKVLPLFSLWSRNNMSTLPMGTPSISISPSFILKLIKPINIPLIKNEMNPISIVRTGYILFFTFLSIIIVTSLFKNYCINTASWKQIL